MLRILVLLLLLANTGYFAWSHGWLAGVGLKPVEPRESQRVNQQIAPERIELRIEPVAATPAASGASAVQSAAAPSALVTVGAAASAPGTSPAAQAGQCLQAGLLTDKQSKAARQILQTHFPKDAWQFETLTEPPGWVIYMGRYPDNAMRERKKAQLRRIPVPFETLRDATMEPGISLGIHPTQETAQQALNRLSKQGVNTAQVVQEHVPFKGQRVTLSKLDETLQTKLALLKPALAGKPWVPCKPV